MTNLSIKKIREEFRTEAKSLNSGSLSAYKVYLAGEYSYWSEMYSDTKIKSEEWQSERREDYKSDIATKRAWNITDDGKKQIKLKQGLKSLEKMISAISSRLEHLKQDRIYMYQTNGGSN